MMTTNNDYKKLPEDNEVLRSLHQYAWAYDHRKKANKIKYACAH